MAKREEYIDKLESQLREWNDQLERLQKRAQNESKELKAKLDKRIDELRVKRAELKVKLDRIKDTGEEAFEKIAKDAEKLWDDIKEGVSDVRSTLKK